LSARLALRSARAAFVFLTRLPVGGFPYQDDEWRWAPAHFPLVGAVVGAVAGCIDRALLPAGDLGAAMLAIGASLLLTGAFHEDGLADTSDALGGAYDRDKIVAILKDSRVGGFGACAIVLSIGGRAALLARLGHEAPWAFAFVGAVARVGPVWQIAAIPYAATDQSKSKGVTAARSVQAGVATAWGLAVAAAVASGSDLAPSRLAAVFVAMTLVTVLSGWRYLRRLGGLTGDFLGATEQLCELAACAVLAWSHG
jgi:adenosylcobinamide-GDP ribazoletransferase